MFCHIYPWFLSLHVDAHRLFKEKVFFWRSYFLTLSAGSKPGLNQRVAPGRASGRKPAPNRTLRTKWRARTESNRNNIIFSPKYRITPRTNQRKGMKLVLVFISDWPCRRWWPTGRGSRRSLCSTSTLWRSRTSLGTRRRSRTPAWSVWTRGCLGSAWFCLGSAPEVDRKFNFSIKSAFYKPLA